MLLGFEFSEVEPSALVQKQGGPCAVIAPVQAYLLKILLHAEELGSALNFNEVRRKMKAVVFETVDSPYSSNADASIIVCFIFSFSLTGVDNYSSMHFVVSWLKRKVEIIFGLRCSTWIHPTQKQQVAR